MIDLEKLFAVGRFDFEVFYNNVKSPDWPECASIHDFGSLPHHIQNECIEAHDLIGHIQRCDNTSIEDGRIVVPHLEWHAAHACNFTCESCSHLSNHRHNEVIDIHRLENWFTPWVDRIVPRQIAILGGEPLLNKQIVDIVKMTRDMWHTTSGQVFELVTNGFLLDRYPELPQALADTKCRLIISYHGPGKQYDNKMKEVMKTVARWKDEWGIEAKSESPDISPEGPWARTFNGYGNHMMPYQDNDPQSSWKNCPTGQNCFQLLDSNIYKCAPLAYLPMQAKKYKLNTAWDQYLSYQPLTPDSSQDDIRRFYNRGAESYCSMCPSKKIRFKKRDPMIPVAYYEKNIDGSAEPVIEKSAIQAKL